MEYKYLDVTLQIDKRQIKIAKDSVYRLLPPIEGIEASEYNIVLSENAQLDGAFISNKKIMPRTINLTFEINDLSNTESYRKLLVSFLTPKKSGTLIIARAGIERRIDFELQSVIFHQNTLYDFLSVELSLICADPYFRDGHEQVREMIERIPLLTFPFNSIKGVGITAGISRRIDTITIDNTGDGEIGIIAKMVAEGGTVSNPQVSNNGRFVKIIDVLQDEDEVTINTNPGNKRILKNGNSIFKFDRKSIFFLLPVGKSNVSITADLNKDNMHGTLIYSLKYLGI